jgi:hypothetical protein
MHVIHGDHQLHFDAIEGDIPYASTTDQFATIQQNAIPDSESFWPPIISEHLKLHFFEKVCDLKSNLTFTGKNLCPIIKKFERHYLSSAVSKDKSVYNSSYIGAILTCVARCRISA